MLLYSSGLMYREKKMLRFTAAAFLILCFAAYDVSAAGMSDVDFNKSIQEIEAKGKKSWEVKDALSQAVKLKEGSQGKSERLEQLKKVVTPILEGEIPTLTGTLRFGGHSSGFESVIKSALLIKSNIETFYEGEEAATLKESLAAKLEEILHERVEKISCPELDSNPLSSAVKEALVIKKQISPLKL